MIRCYRKYDESQAVQFNKVNLQECIDWLGDDLRFHYDRFYLRGLPIEFGSYIVRESNGILTFYSEKFFTENYIINKGEANDYNYKCTNGTN